MTCNNESLQILDQLKELKNMYFEVFNKVNYSESERFIKLESNYINLTQSLINVSQSAVKDLYEKELPHCNSFDIVNVLELTKNYYDFQKLNF
ncbi:hypothetical protein TSEDIMI_60059 [Tenacibaculum sediminilitoris]|uniref:hypothetical protein n=1 Tax=Tenacibaculum sediminilitoris TaxID=1820334 RepID=UPI0038942C67